MKTEMTDMDMGEWTYLPNALGELLNIRDAKTSAPNWTTIIGYDPLGRMTSRQDVAEGVTSTFTFGVLADNSTSHKYIGHLKKMSGPGYTENYTLDSVGRPETTTIISDATYNIDYAYNAIGALHTLTYPTSTSGYRLKLQYDYENGLLKRVKDFNAPTIEFWQANATDPRGAVIDETLDNGLQTIRGFDLVTGLIDSIATGPSGSGSIQDLSYAWDKVGNLTQRKDERQSDLTEAFTYDNLHRLTGSTLNGTPNLSVSYDARGNILSKTDAGTVAPNSTTTWYSYHLPNTITASGGSASQFFYTPDRARWKQAATYDGVVEATIYIGGLIEKVTLGSVTSWKHYIAGGTGPVAVYTRKSGAADEMHYLTKDHLGSVDSVTNATGGVEVRLSYSAFGQRRQEAGWSGTPTPADLTQITGTTRRGFTFHEMLDNLNLIHMNGRVYDQVVGRFLSADPYVQAPGFTQSFNRYSYTFNSPLTFTDPSGYCGGSGEPTCHLDGGRSESIPFVDSARDGGFDRHGPTVRWLREFRNAAASTVGGDSIGVLYNGVAYTVSEEPIGDYLCAKTGQCQTRPVVRPDCNVYPEYKHGSCEAVYPSFAIENAILVGVGAFSLVRAAIAANTPEVVIGRLAQVHANSGLQALAASQMSVKELAAVLAGSRASQAMLGQAVHKATAQSLAELYPGKYLYFPRAPYDFVYVPTGQVFELTTFGQAGSHAARGADLILYTLPR